MLRNLLKILIFYILAGSKLIQNMYDYKKALLIWIYKYIMALIYVTFLL